MHKIIEIYNILNTCWFIGNVESYKIPNVWNFMVKLVEID